MKNKKTLWLLGGCLLLTAIFTFYSLNFLNNNLYLADAADKQYNVPVLSLSYLPLDNKDQSKINLDIVGPYLSEGTTIDEIRQKIKRINSELITGLETGSSFHLYKDSSSKPALKYSIVDSKEFLRPILRTSNSKWLFLDQGDWGLTADHHTELSNINICDYVDKKGVKEVWIWMYHYGPDKDKDGKADLDANRYHVSPAESNMASTYFDNAMKSKLKLSEKKPINGTCGKINKTYAPKVTLKTVGLCSSGNPNGLNIYKSNWWWNCAGSNGGTSIWCMAYRAENNH